MFALSESGRPDAVRPLLEVVDDAEEDPVVRGTAAKCIGNLGSSAALDRLLALAERERSSLYLSVIEAIGRLRDVRAVPALVTLLGDDDPGVRFAVIGALEQLDSAETREAPARASKDSSWHVRVRARRARKRLSAV